MQHAHRADFRAGSFGAWAALLGASGTLACCALPALLVALGAGAALSTLVAAVPQIVWLSEHKTGVFAAAALLLALGGWSQWRQRRAPCPLAPEARAACLTLRRRSRVVYTSALGVFGIGSVFAFALG
jgi:hypothetical protein